ncbi:MAG: CHAT domain-containing protein, partial [Blastocatellia bacterium]
MALKSLSRVTSDREIEALYEWVEGISDITKGKLEAAVGHLDKATFIFGEIGRKHDSAQPQVAKLLALAMLGRYDEATATGRRALNMFVRLGDQLAAGKIELNLSNVVSRREKHRDAEKFCLSARRRFSQLGERSWLTMAENGLANTYSELNDFRNAEKYYASALRHAREAGMLVTEAEIEASMGNLAKFRGRFAKALNFLELSRRKFEELKMPHQMAIAELEIAGIYSELNLIGEATELFSSTAKSFRSLKMRLEEAEARKGFGFCSGRIGANTIAKRELKRTVRLYESERNAAGAASALLDLATVALGQLNYKDSLQFTIQAETLISNADSPRLIPQAKLIRARALIGLGEIESASSLLRTVYQGTGRSAQLNLSVAALNLLGKLSLRSGRTKESIHYFERSVKLVEKLRAPLPSEEFRMAFLSDKLEPFEILTAIYLASNRIPEAFWYLERSRSRSLLESMTDGIGSKPQSKKLSTTISALREDLNWLYSKLDRAAGDEARKLSDEVRRLEKKIADATRQNESTMANLSRSKAIADSGLNISSFQQTLRPEKALIEFMLRDGVFSAFVVTNETISHTGDLCTESEILDTLGQLHFQFGSMRYGEKLAASVGSILKRRVDIILEKIYSLLLCPFEDRFGKRNLVIVPASSLYYVPFHALRSDGKYLVESCEVSYSPGAAIWHHLDRKRRKRPRNAFLIGFADEKIPLVNREIATLKKVLPESKSFIGQAATFDVFTKNAGKFDLLHIACHGQFRPDNPLFSSLHLADGWINVRDIYSQRLKASLVTLSACETGLNMINAENLISGV